MKRRVSLFMQKYNPTNVLEKTNIAYQLTSILDIWISTHENANTTSHFVRLVIINIS